eukprot:scaffold9469_cov93-Skeletonema_marinoi.AAC.2
MATVLLESSTRTGPWFLPQCYCYYYSSTASNAHGAAGTPNEECSVAHPLVCPYFVCSSRKVVEGSSVFIYARLSRNTSEPLEGML